MHIPGSYILLIFVTLLAAVILLLLHLTKLGLLIHQKIPDRPHRRLFLASVSFFITFLAVRLLVASITHHIGPFGYVEMGGTHIHHLVWGILLLLFTGYAELGEVGTGETIVSIFMSRLLALSYGIGAALTLDEFALWLNLDAADYWTSQGRESIDAVVLFGALLGARRCFDGWTSPATNHPGRRHSAQQEPGILDRRVTMNSNALSSRLLTCFGYITGVQLLSGLNSVIVFASPTVLSPRFFS